MDGSCGDQVMRIGVTANVGGDPERVRYTIVLLVAWLSDELARRLGYVDAISDEEASDSVNNGWYIEETPSTTFERRGK